MGGKKIPKTTSLEPAPEAQVGDVPNSLSAARHATAEEFVSCLSRPSLHLPLHLHRRPELARPGLDRPLPFSSGK
jgi:hypothetical protein